MLGEGLHRVAPGRLATIVTHLELRAPPDLPECALPDGLVLERLDRPAPDRYRALFRQVGEDWLWTSRLEMTDASLSAILSSPDVEVWTLRCGEEDLALLELDFRAGQACELAFLGLARELTGQGIGRCLIAHAIARAWSRPIHRLWIHTCTHDSPAALPFYRKCGFVPFRREVEVMDDPRLSGLLRPDAAPHIPLIRPE